MASFDVITMPDGLSANQFVSRMELRFAESKIDPSFLRYEGVYSIICLDWDAVRGRSLQACVHDFRGCWELEDGRELQNTLGFDGNIAAALIWAIGCKRVGSYITVPNDDGRLIRELPRDRGLVLEYFYFRGRTFNFKSANNSSFSECDLLLAFRVI